MTFRTRLLAAFGVVVLVPLLVFGLGVRREVARRFAAAYEQRMAAQVSVIRSNLRRETDLITDRLGRLAQALRDDNRFRAALLRGEDRAYLLDYAGQEMRVLGLDFLQIQDDEGRIVSSGQFRNEFDRAGPRVRGLSLVRAPTAEGKYLALVGRNGVGIGGRELTLLGGVTVDTAFLLPSAGDSEFTLQIVLADHAEDAPAAELVVWSTELPFIDADDPSNMRKAQLAVTHSNELAELERTVNLWFVVAVLLAALAALLLASWLSTRISRPLDAQMRDMERRVAMGDLARQVNHDVKNGLSPLRNVFRHLVQVAREEPAKLPAIFVERQGTVESSITYLETLAANYARLYPQSDRRPTDVNAVVRAAVGGGGTAVKTKLTDGVAPASVDALVLRRVIENLVTNAVDSLEGRAGSVVVGTERGNGVIRVTVSDTGRGMTKAELDKAFDDFYTTKTGGTGLGLSIVRRLVLDSGGSLKVETEPGEGSKFIVELPAIA